HDGPALEFDFAANLAPFDRFNCIEKRQETVKKHIFFETLKFMIQIYDALAEDGPPAARRCSKCWA
ncbi:MAG: hypothetical protein N3D11_13695, partial [Candidatus Sumerlaeia bacterium]|nr:hypothetical protein [Candidatus Sumerlaeia bacterium]